MSFRITAESLQGRPSWNAAANPERGHIPFTSSRSRRTASSAASNEIISAGLANDLSDELIVFLGPKSVTSEQFEHEGEALCRCLWWFSAAAVCVVDHRFPD